MMKVPNAQKKGLNIYEKRVSLIERVWSYPTIRPWAKNKTARYKILHV